MNSHKQPYKQRLATTCYDTQASTPQIPLDWESRFCHTPLELTKVSKTKYYYSARADVQCQNYEIDALTANSFQKVNHTPRQPKLLVSDYSYGEIDRKQLSILPGPPIQSGKQIYLSISQKFNGF